MKLRQGSNKAGKMRLQSQQQCS